MQGQFPLGFVTHLLELFPATSQMIDAFQVSDSAVRTTLGKGAPKPYLALSSFVWLTFYRQPELIPSLTIRL